MTRGGKVAASLAGAATVAALALPLTLSSGGSIDVFVGSTPTPATTPDPCAGFNFCDEFSAASVDTTKWIAVNTHADLSNSEPGCYTSANVAEGSGVLTETVEHRTFTCGDTTGSSSYALGAIQSKTYSFTRGTVEAKIKFTGGTGTWPAFWLLGTNCQSPQWLVNGADPAGCNWPAAGSQEIDIAEFNGSNPKTTVRENLITAAGTDQCLPTVSDASAGFHVYSLTWTLSSLVWKVDTVTKCTISVHIPTTPMFVIINSSAGGASGGTITDSDLPQTTTVDYVHVTEG
jgi:beta-glucanase (GH16 family)